MTEAVPTVEELERFTIEELRQKMFEMKVKIQNPFENTNTDDDNGDLPVTDKRSLAIILNKVLNDQKEAADTQQNAAAIEESSRLRSNVPLVIIGICVYAYICIFEKFHLYYVHTYFFNIINEIHMNLKIIIILYICI